MNIRGEAPSKMRRIPETIGPEGLRVQWILKHEVLDNRAKGEYGDENALEV